MQKLIIGIDLGGSSCKVGLVNREGQLLHFLVKPTPVDEGYTHVLSLFQQMTEQLLQEAGNSWDEIAGIGVGVPAILNLEKGDIVEAVNLKWKHVPFREDLERLWQVPVRVDNDSNVAALGEMWTGAGKGVSHLLCLTIGTGVGSGVIINGQIYHGANASAGEIGHMQVREEGGRPCNCGRSGCLETEVSATAILSDALEQVQGLDTGILREEYLRTGCLTAKSVIQYAQKGDPTSLAILERVGILLGKTLARMCYLLNPQLIVIGGGVSNAGDALFKPLNQAFRTAEMPRVFENTTIVKAQLGNQAGMIGAAWLIHDLIP